MLIDSTLLDNLTEEARRSPRLRMNYDLRNSFGGWVAEDVERYGAGNVDSGAPAHEVVGDGGGDQGGDTAEFL